MSGQSYSEFPVLSLEEYQSLTSNLPRPSPRQIENFVLYVSHAHSWYKDIRLLAVPFTFFLDPGAGQERITRPDGSIQLSDRGPKGFHYNWRSTTEYRKSFGYLQYCNAKSSSLTFTGSEVARTMCDVAPTVYNSKDDQLWRIPNEVVDVGVAFVTGVMHARSAYPFVWIRWIFDELSLDDWPGESGGSRQFGAIVDRCRYLFNNFDALEPVEILDPRVSRLCGTTGIDNRLYKLLSQERERQRAGMVAAIERMVHEISAASGKA